jgi:hypothetical protein
MEIAKRHYSFKLHHSPLPKWLARLWPSEQGPRGAFGQPMSVGHDQSLHDCGQSAHGGELAGV